ncbi:MAG TPA: c-type cytochrome [Thermodesulfovibrionales bacterium]|nr:c-type cytochrome [Thermodesulfovibrionales bacterium]
MKGILGVLICALAVFLMTAVGFAKEEAKVDLGGNLFKKHCVACHPEGGNIIKPEKSLRKKDREANKVMVADDIIKLMRNPGPGMVKFGEKVIPEKEAKAIADYILKTFK